MSDSRGGRLIRWPLLLGVWAAPASIAASEFFLSVAALGQLRELLRRRARLLLPDFMVRWLLWMGLAAAIWLQSPEPLRGWSEIRHMLLVTVVMITLQALVRRADRVAAWQGVFLVAGGSSALLIGDFVYRLFKYRGELEAGGDAGFYLRSRIVHHWMIYGTLEVLVAAGFLSFWWAYPEKRRRWWPVAAVNAAAVVLSLTRMAWVACGVLLAVSLLCHRPRWLPAIPAAALAVWFAAPPAVAVRVRQSLDPAYYSNFERVQMLRVGWNMLAAHPFTGVGPGRVELLYAEYAPPGQPLPAYRGHLHNNAAQLAAQFGFPMVFAAGALAALLFRDLWRARRYARDRTDRFVAEAALLAFLGFNTAGLFEYTYGHSLVLILLTFAIVPALLPPEPSPESSS